MQQSINVAISPGLSNAWQRMKYFLFQPFDLGKWFVVGFAAFLASLGDRSSGGGGDLGWKFSDVLDRKANDDWSGNMESWSDSAGEYLDHIVSNAWMFALAGFLMILGLALVVLLLWLSSRGRFVLLDNLVTGKAGITAPWRQHARLGDSLFRWQIVFTLACLLVFGVFAVLAVMLFLPIGVLGIHEAVAIPLVIMLGSLGFILIVTAVYVEFFLHNFVVPIMYRHGLNCSGAWSRFQTLFSQYPGWFVLYGLVYLMVSIAGTLALLLGGFLTCCLGLVLLMLPYISSVVSLPLTVWLRYWGLEFLGQFGPDFQLLGPLPDNSDHPSIYDNTDRTVVGPEDVSQDAGGGEPRPEGP